MQKRQQINVQQEYKDEEFLEPQQLEGDQIVPVQYQQSKEDNEEVLNRQQISQTQQANHVRNNNRTNIISPSPCHKPTKLSSPTQPSKNPSSRSSLEQQSETQQQIRNQLILQFKISQLQKICTTLTSANEKLLDKIEQLQEENEKYKERVVESERSRYERGRRENDYAQSLNDSREERGDQSVEESNYQKQQSSKDQSQLLGDDDEQQKLLQEQVVDIELMIKQYRQELNKAEQVNKNIKSQLSEKINQLQEQLSHSHQQLTDTQRINSQLQQQLADTLQRNSSLEKQIQTIINSTNVQGLTHYQYYEDPTSRDRTESRSSQYMTPVHRANYHNPNRIPPSYYDQQYTQQQTNQLFDSSVQLELENLIQKLVNQLQHERLLKKKMTQEIKRIQKDLLQSEKEIMLKNKKIYQLEMNLLKGEKNHLFNLNSNCGNSHIGNGGNNNHNNITTLGTSQIHQYHQNKHQQKTKYSIFSPSKQQTRTYNSPTPKDMSPKIRDKYLLQQKQRVNTSAVNYSNQSPPNRQQSPVLEAYTNKAREFGNLSNVMRNPNMSQSPSSGQTKHLQTFSLLELLNQPTITLTVKQKLHISLKLVEFYEQKIYQYKNYNLLMLENVLVTNFNRIKLGLVKIRVQQHKRTEQGHKNLRNRKNSKDEAADGPQKVIWNLGFLLNSLLLDVPTKEDDLGMSSAEQSVLELIDGVLDNKMLSKEVLGQLKECLEVALQQRVK